MLYLEDTPQKVDKIHREMCFAYSCIFSIQPKSEVQLFHLRIAVNAIFLFHSCPSSFVSNKIYHRIDGILLTSSGGLEPITKAQKRPNIFDE